MQLLLEKYEFCSKKYEHEHKNFKFIAIKGLT